MHNTALVSVRAVRFFPAREEGGEASIVFSSPHSEFEVFFEWARGELWEKRREQSFGHIKYVGDDREWTYALAVLAKKCREAVRAERGKE